MTARREKMEEFGDTTLGLEDAAKVMRLGVESMKELVENGTVPAVRLNQKHTVLLREDLINFLREEGRRQAAARRESATSTKRRSDIVQCTSSIGHQRKNRRTRLPNLDAYDIEG